MKRDHMMEKQASAVSALPVNEGERSEPERAGRAPTAPDPEVRDKPVRKKFSVEYKLRILRLADSCVEPGSVGTLLRREGLYFSNLVTWRRQREEGTLAALKPKKRGRKATDPNPLASENIRLKRENERLAKRLQKAELIIDVQKKISQILGITLENSPERERL
jgi:transposase